MNTLQKEPKHIRNSELVSINVKFYCVFHVVFQHIKRKAPKVLGVLTYRELSCAHKKYVVERVMCLYL